MKGKQILLLSIAIASLALMSLAIPMVDGTEETGQDSNPFDVDITINITDPTDDIDIVIPGDPNGTLPDIDIVIEDPTDPAEHEFSKENLSFSKNNGVTDIVTSGTKRGAKSSPAIVRQIIGKGSSTISKPIPDNAKEGGVAGTSVIISLISHIPGKNFEFISPPESDNRNTPHISSNQFIATTMVGVMIMGFATIFSARSDKITIPFIAPLYSRIERDKVLENPTRENIYRLIANNPGMDLLSIKLSLALSNGVVAHHIHTLEREKYLRSIRDGRFRRFYVCGTRVDALSSTERRIMNTLETNPFINQTQIATKLGVSRQSLNYHVKKLVTKGVIETEKRGRETYVKRRDS